MPHSVYDYFTYRLGDAVKSHDIAASLFPDHDIHYYKEEAPLYSHCGEASRHVIDAAFNMLIVCDPHPQITGHILQAAKQAIDIIWYG